MQYILLILVISIGIFYFLGKLLRRKDREMAEKNDFLYTEKQKEFFKGENKKLYITQHGKLIEKEETISGEILNNKQ